MEALKEAISIAGSQSALARLIGKKQGHIWWWLNEKSPLPPAVAIEIERVTGVPRHELRSDLWEPPA